jgi:hypothetical protein
MQIMPDVYGLPALGTPAAGEETDLAALFALLPDEPLPPGSLERLTWRVLHEVQHTLTGAVEADESGHAPLRRLRLALERLRAWLRRLTPTQSLLLAGAGAVAAMLLFVGVSRITPRPLTATAAVSGGDATVLTRHTSRFRIQHDGDLLKLRQGDRVLTADGSVQLSHFPDHLTVIEPGADVEVTQLDDAGGGQQLALTVHDGAVRSTLEAPLQPGDQYVIYTPGVMVAAAGTDFAVETISERETLVTTFAGRVAVTMGEQTVTVGPGQEVDAITGKALKVQPAE